ncbi:MAG: DJ-1/PfpI family protein [Pseudomonadota bacterium]
MDLETEPMEQWRDRPIHTLLIAGGFGALTAARGSKFLENVVALAANAGRVGSVCTGALVLAASGLLNGHRAVTHWYSCDALADQHSDVQVEPDRIFINDGGVWTSAGLRRVSIWRWPWWQKIQGATLQSGWQRFWSCIWSGPAANLTSVPRF